MGYLAFICFYVSSQPIGGREFVDNDKDQTSDWGLEIALWTMNIGYVLYEIVECIGKGFTEYLSLGGNNQNLLDITIRIIWIFLFGVKSFFLYCDDTKIPQNMYNY